jgi:hypothetical protein
LSSACSGFQPIFDLIKSQSHETRTNDGHRHQALLGTGFLMHQDVLITAGLLLVAHSSFDRMLGYGLKFSDDFKHTNLGWMGKVGDKTGVVELP